MQFKGSDQDDYFKKALPILACPKCAKAFQAFLPPGYFWVVGFVFATSCECGFHFKIKRIA